MLTIVPNFLRPINFCKNYVISRSERKIQSGPFKGVSYIETSFGSAYFPKLLGTYEKELHPFLNVLSGIKLDKAVIIGAGEGYYAIGLASKLKIKVDAYEMEMTGQKMIKSLARLNHVSEIVEVYGKCTPEILHEMDKHKKYLFVIDVEGGEHELLLNGSLDRFYKSDFIIEIHYIEQLPEFEEKLKEKFKTEFIPVQKRGVEDFTLKIPRWSDYILKRYWKSLVQEWRTTNSYGWLLVSPKSDAI